MLNNDEQRKKRIKGMIFNRSLNYYEFLLNILNERGKIERFWILNWKYNY